VTCMVQSQTEGACSCQEPSEVEVAQRLDDLAISLSSGLIGVLQEVQDHFGYLPASALEYISRVMRIPLSRVYGVVSFYAQFYTEPRGRHTVLCCRGTACHVRGASQVIEAVKRKLGVDEGESTTDLKFYLETVACLGTCFLAPVMMIDDEYYGNLTPRQVEDILDNFQAAQ